VLPFIFEVFGFQDIRDDSNLIDQPSKLLVGLQLHIKLCTRRGAVGFDQLSKLLVGSQFQIKQFTRKGILHGDFLALIISGSSELISYTSINSTISLDYIYALQQKLYNI